MADDKTMTSTNPFPEPLDPDIAAWVTTLDDNTRELFEERAGIREFEGGLSRSEAEREARNDVLRWLERQAAANDEL